MEQEYVVRFWAARSSLHSYKPVIFFVLSGHPENNRQAVFRQCSGQAVVRQSSNCHESEKQNHLLRSLWD